jgi:hypothetical protein
MPEEDGEKRIVVFAQITSALCERVPRSHAAVNAFPQERPCADYDDDNGYAFIVRVPNLTDSTALPFRMFGAHCVALRLSLNVLTVSD